MTKEELYEQSFMLITHSGNARSCAMEAIQSIKQKNQDECEAKLKEADEEFVKAHRIQTELIQKEASGETFEIPIVFIHAQDHLMNAMTTVELAKEIIDLHKVK
ncbi:PTS lactose/cellobiose transporter subunit IIA [Oceanobacillus jeddahense]|uniref:PTS lactose/cellobiose transporter subunit IIA n=1 Tax=Oceanobacillus jeddahense TaxID=1462527 RepID=A0ABY5JQ02_9BACI|nr:PTS lactose/cellobiose transporter subunit IIA [Oceanobacillus jeddahense]UUI02376.1 PTS lactose/cellobiose transporter subunit IIA [Oceanobacillus jeddahense]